MALSDCSAAEAVSSARAGDPTQFQEAVRKLEQQGWGAVESEVAEEFVGEVSSVLGDAPTVNDIVNLSQALYPQTSLVISASVFDLEFLIRGHAGAALLGEAIPRNVAIAMQLAVLGALDSIEGFQLGNSAFD